MADQSRMLPVCTVDRHQGTQAEVRVPTRRGTLASMAAEEGEVISYATTHLVAFLAGIPNAGPGAGSGGVRMDSGQHVAGLQILVLRSRR